jgi:hypothetical protein
VDGRLTGSYPASTTGLVSGSRLLARKSSTDEMGVYRARKLFPSMSFELK